MVDKVEKKKKSKSSLSLVAAAPGLEDREGRGRRGQRRVGRADVLLVRRGELLGPLLGLELDGLDWKGVGRKREEREKRERGERRRWRSTRKKEKKKRRKKKPAAAATRFARSELQRKHSMRNLISCSRYHHLRSSFVPRW